MEADSPAHSTAADKTKPVKAARDKAPDGPRTDAALKHYKAAGKAQTEKKDTECGRALDAAEHVLA
jgi:hypothetical protein